MKKRRIKKRSSVAEGKANFSEELKLGFIMFIALLWQSAGTALNVKGWQGVSYSLLTKATWQGFTSKLEE